MAGHPKAGSAGLRAQIPGTAAPSPAFAQRPLHGWPQVATLSRGLVLSNALDRRVWLEVGSVEALTNLPRSQPAAHGHTQWRVVCVEPPVSCIAILASHPVQQVVLIRRTGLAAHIDCHACQPPRRQNSQPPHMHSLSRSQGRCVPCCLVHTSCCIPTDL